MSDTLIEMKKTLKERQAALASLKKKATDVNSFGGKEIIPFEAKVVPTTRRKIGKVQLSETIP